MLGLFGNDVATAGLESGTAAVSVWPAMQWRNPGGAVRERQWYRLTGQVMPLEVTKKVAPSTEQSTALLESSPFGMEQRVY